MNGQLLLISFYSLLLFGAGAPLGYYIGLVREHRHFMVRLDKLTKDLQQIERDRNKAIKIDSWESQSRN